MFHFCASLRCFAFCDLVGWGRTVTQKNKAPHQFQDSFHRRYLDEQVMYLS